MDSINQVRGIRNNNPGNIERNKGTRWQGMSEDQSSDPRFVVFDSPKWGVRAMARILITYQDKRRARDGSDIDSIQEIVDRWAPSHENPSDAYAQFIARQINRAADDETLDVYDYHTMRGLVRAIIKFECGAQPYSEKIIDNGLRLAGIDVPMSEPKKSRTIRASVAGAGAVGAGAIMEQLDSAKAMLQPLAEHSQLIQYGLTAITVIALGVVVWARIDDANKGAR